MPTESLVHLLPRIVDEELEFEKYLNLLVALLDRRANSEIARGRPFEVTIDPSTVCQLSCPYCELGNGTIRRARSFLDPSLHGRMLDQLGPGVFIAWYFSTGEPLLNKRLPEIVGATRGRGIFAIVSTNLSMALSDERIDELLRCGLGVISVSLDGASAETYGRYRVGGDFALVVENLKRLLARRARLGLRYPLVEWRFLVFRHNQHEIPEARRLAAELGVDLLEFFPGYAPPEAAEHEVQPAKEPVLDPVASGPALEAARSRRDSALRRLPQGGRSRHGARGLSPAMRYRKCDWLYFGTMLFPSGAVSPCCVSNNEPDDFGAIEGGAPFGVVWNNAKFREARRFFARGEETSLVCARCPNRDAQDYQFSATLRALLMNAPDWVVEVLAYEPDRFLFDVDLVLLADEVEALRAAAQRIRPGAGDTLRRLDRAEAASDGARERIREVSKLLAASRESRRRAGGWGTIRSLIRGALGRGRPS